MMMHPMQYELERAYHSRCEGGAAQRRMTADACQNVTANAFEPWLLNGVRAAAADIRRLILGASGIAEHVNRTGVSGPQEIV